ncbi:hypothetical protein CEQ23_40425 [Burkholderia cepacia]|nr:hypothetical protein CEQ23_40425 [Burkholderia cepacia]QCY05158.1 hypothetical protein EJ998_18725 [Burkholderia cepacia ATCC 25416]
MGRFVDGEDRKQVTLRPECLDDFIAEDRSLPLHRLHELSRSPDWASERWISSLAWVSRDGTFSGTATTEPISPTIRSGGSIAYPLGARTRFTWRQGGSPISGCSRSIPHMPSCRHSAKSAALSANRH